MPKSWLVHKLQHSYIDRNIKLKRFSHNTYLRIEEPSFICFNSLSNLWFVTEALSFNHLMISPNTISKFSGDSPYKSPCHMVGYNLKVLSELEDTSYSSLLTSLSVTLSSSPWRTINGIVTCLNSIFICFIHKFCWRLGWHAQIEKYQRRSIIVPSGKFWIVVRNLFGRDIFTTYRRRLRIQKVKKIPRKSKKKEKQTWWRFFSRSMLTIKSWWAVFKRGRPL